MGAPVQTEPGSDHGQNEAYGREGQLGVQVDPVRGGIVALRRHLGRIAAQFAETHLAAVSDRSFELFGGQVEVGDQTVAKFDLHLPGFAAQVLDHHVKEVPSVVDKAPGVGVQTLHQAKIAIETVDGDPASRAARCVVMANVGDRAVAFDPYVLFPGERDRFLSDFAEPNVVGPLHGGGHDGLGHHKEHDAEAQAEGQGRVHQPPCAYAARLEGQDLVILVHPPEGDRHGQQQTEGQHLSHDKRELVGKINQRPDQGHLLFQKVVHLLEKVHRQVNGHHRDQDDKHYPKGFTRDIAVERSACLPQKNKKAVRVKDQDRFRRQGQLRGRSLTQRHSSQPPSPALTRLGSHMPTRGGRRPDSPRTLPAERSR